MNDEAKNIANVTFDEVTTFVGGGDFENANISTLEEYRRRILSLPIFSDGRTGEMYKIQMCYNSIDGRINLLRQIKSDKENNSKFRASLYVSLTGLLVALAALYLSYFQQPTAP